MAQELPTSIVDIVEVMMTVCLGSRSGRSKSARMATAIKVISIRVRYDFIAVGREATIVHARR